MNSKDKQKQLRLTLQDTLYFQDRLRVLVKLLRDENRPLAHKEKQQFFMMLPKALLSQGSVDPTYFVQSDGWFIFSSVQNLALRLADLSTDRVFMKTTRPENIEITISISELWQFLYDKILYLFPQATAEAIHISAESVERSPQGVYDFSAKGDLS